MEELEPRLLFSADLPGVLAESGLLADGRDPTPPAITALVDTPSVGFAVGNDRGSRAESAFALVSPMAGVSADKELVFVDAGAPNYQQLINDLMKAQAEGRAIEVVVLEKGRDGVEQITEAMAERRDIAAVHIVSHGSDGSLSLGNAELSAYNVEKYRDAIASWKGALTEGADLLIYGCDFAGSAQGREMVETLSAITGADVAASSDRTGAASQGGDWELEVTEGSIETELAFSEALQSAYEDTLNTYTVSTAGDSGAGSLRQAIIDANANAGTDSIVFDIAGGGPQTISLASVLPTISGTVNLDATSQGGFVDQPIITLDGSGAGLGADGLRITASDSTIRGLVIDGFDDNGIEVEFGSNNVIEGNVITGSGDDGIWVNDASNTIIQDNYVGLRADGVTPDGNGRYGIFVEGSSSGTLIGGAAAGQGNVIADSGDNGIEIDADNITIRGNFVGTDASGAVRIENSNNAVAFSGDNIVIGGTTAWAGNVITGADEGIDGRGDSAVIQGNFIGVDRTGTIALGNDSNGIEYTSGTNVIIGGTGPGEANIIANSGDNGILLTGSGTRVTVTGNAIYSSGLLNIDLGDDGVTVNDAGDPDSDVNTLQNYPVLTSAVSNDTEVTIIGSLNSTANTDFTLDFYANVAGGSGPVLCAACHSSNALPGTGLPGVSSLTSAVHSGHAAVVDPLTGMTMESSSNRASCYRCHPGSDTRCLRGAMGSAVAATGARAMQCQDCHGTMAAVGDAQRAGWLDEPACQNCHTGTALNNNGQIRYTSALEANGQYRTAVNATFATDANVPASGFSLYRFSTGHGGLRCDACHGSTHAVYPSAHGNDNIASEAMQGHGGTLVECTACHSSTPQTVRGGPHGMHPVGQSWIDGHKDAAENGRHLQCRACHGTDYRGTVLSEMQADRTLQTEWGPKTFWRGSRISCWGCHRGPTDDDRNSNRRPVVQNATAATATAPVAITLHASDPDNNPLTLRIVSQPAGGRVALAGNVATYYPESGIAGPDEFTFAAWDGSIDSNLGTVTVDRLASWVNYGSGYPGTNGIPPLTLAAAPSLGTTPNLQIGNSSGLAAAMAVFISTERASRVTGFGGLLLAEPTSSFTAVLPAAGMNLGLPIPNIPALINVSFYLQSIQIDAGARFALAFSQGVCMTIGR